MVYSFQETFDWQQLDCYFLLLRAVVRGQWKRWEDQTALALGGEGIAAHAALNLCRSLFHKLKLFVSNAWALTFMRWMGSEATKATLQITAFIAGMEWRWSRGGQSQVAHLFWNFEQQSMSKQPSLGSDWQIKQALYTWAGSRIRPYRIPVTEENWRRNLAKQLSSQNYLPLLFGKLCEQGIQVGGYFSSSAWSHTCCSVSRASIF